MKKNLYIFLIIVLIIIILTIFFCVLLNKKFANRYEYGRYGNNGNISLYVKDNEVDIDIYGKKNKLVFSQNKIYYFLPAEKYIYAVTKWNEYLVIQLSNNEIIIDTDNPNKIPEEFLTVFYNIEQFEDFSDLDYMPTDGIISFGDGTIYLRSINQSNPYLYTQKTEDGSHSMLMVEEEITKYILVDNFIYLITENDSYVVIDMNTYSVIYKCWDISKLPKEHQSIFYNKEFDKIRDNSK